ncbi:MAG: division/cell wall cluster transcriptional repressor MraZ [Flavobacteriales bacterium]|nr:division/cell wall cluster transcriptional repressor MraZ [Flavobacteriales bacterium]
MLSIIGSYDCSLDSKGRLPVPVALRKQLVNAIDDGFVLKRSVFQSCLEIYTREEWDKVMKNLDGLNKYVKKNEYFIRVFTAGIKLVEMDGTGRIQLSKDLLEYAKIEKSVVVTAVLNKIEIWDKQLYEKTIAIDENEFASLAEEIMGTENGANLS